MSTKKSTKDKSKKDKEKQRGRYKHEIALSLDPHSFFFSHQCRSRTIRTATIGRRRYDTCRTKLRANSISSDTDYSSTILEARLAELRRREKEDRERKEREIAEAFFAREGQRLADEITEVEELLSVRRAEVAATTTKRKHEQEVSFMNRHVQIWI